MALVLVRLDHIANVIVNADHGIVLKLWLKCPLVRRHCDSHCRHITQELEAATLALALWEKREVDLCTLIAMLDPRSLRVPDDIKPLLLRLCEQSAVAALMSKIRRWRSERWAKTIHPDLERFMAKRMNAKTKELASCHLMMLSHPAEVLKVIEEVANFK